MNATPRRLLLCAAAALACPGASRADRMVLDGTPCTDVTVVGLNQGKLVYTREGTDRAHGVAGVGPIVLDNNPSFNDAEAATAGRYYEKACRLYAQALHGCNSRPLRLLIELRSLDAQQKSHQFLTAVTYYLDVIGDTATPELLARRPTELPEATSSYLTDAADMINQRLKEEAYDGIETQKSLRLLLLDIYNKTQDPRAVTIARDLGAKVDLAATPGEGDAATDPAVRAVRLALSEKQYTAAVEQADRALQNADGPAAVALYMAKADALEGQDKAADAVPVYLRVALIYPTSPEAPAALLAAARIDKALKKDAEAARLLAEIKEKYPGAAGGLKE